MKSMVQTLGPPSRTQTPAAAAFLLPSTAWATASRFPSTPRYTRSPGLNLACAEQQAASYCCYVITFISPRDSRLERWERNDSCVDAPWKNSCPALQLMTVPDTCNMVLTSRRVFICHAFGSHRSLGGGMLISLQAFLQARNLCLERMSDWPWDTQKGGQDRISNPGV